MITMTVMDKIRFTYDPAADRLSVIDNDTGIEPVDMDSWVIPEKILDLMPDSELKERHTKLHGLNKNDLGAGSLFMWNDELIEKMAPAHQFKNAWYKEVGHNTYWPARYVFVQELLYHVPKARAKRSVFKTGDIIKIEGRLKQEMILLKLGRSPRFGDVRDCPWLRLDKDLKPCNIRYGKGIVDPQKNPEIIHKGQGPHDPLYLDILQQTLDPDWYDRRPWTKLS